MTVKTITDSVSDLPAEAAKELGITVVPPNVRSGAIAAVLGDKE
jgi:fatty acid-binding protein DegV